MKIRKCYKCGALVKVFHDCPSDECGIICCNEKMSLLKANTADAAAEKHVPEYEIVGDKIIARVNHVMEEDHYIEWIAYSYDHKEIFAYLKPGEKAEVEFEYVKGAVIYSYCNKHGLWSKEITM